VSFKKYAIAKKPPQFENFMLCLLVLKVNNYDIGYFFSYKFNS